MNQGRSQSTNWRLRGLLVLSTAVLALIAVMFLSAPAYAQGGGTCVDDVTGWSNQCNANEVVITSITNTQAITCTEGDPVALNLTVRLWARAQERYDIGMFLALDGGTAYTGLCQHDYLPPPLTIGGLCAVSGDDCRKDADCEEAGPCIGGYNPDGGIPYLDAEPGEGDLCGDIERRVATVRQLAPVTVQCTDPDGDRQLNIGAIVSWDNLDSNLCLTATDAKPNTPAKCSADLVNVGNVTVLPGAIQVVKTANPAELTEPGGDVTFTYTVVNPSVEVTMTLRLLTDTVYGNLWMWEPGDCAVDVVLSPGEMYTCSITAPVTGTVGVHENTVAAGAENFYDPRDYVRDTATAQVVLQDDPPALSVTKVVAPVTVEEPGGVVRYVLTVNNLSGPSDPVTLTVLLDSLYGDLSDSELITGTCPLEAIAPQASYSCTFEARVSGLSGQRIADTVIVTGTDNEGTAASASDAAVVTIVPKIPPAGTGMAAAAVAGGAIALGLGLVGLGTFLRRRRD